MARPIKASLFVPSFTPTSNPGEYTFEPATFTNQSDATGNGAFDAVAGALLYVPASDANSGFPVAGVVHRYQITQLTHIDSTSISGTILWDEAGPEIDLPTNGSYCLYAESTPAHHLGLPPSDQVYPELPPGSTVASMLLDTRDIIDVTTESTTLRGSATTTDGVPTKLTIGSLTYVPLAETDFLFNTKILGKRNDDIGACAFTLSGVVNRSGATVASVGGTLKSILARTDPSFDANVFMDSTNGGLSIVVTGKTGATVSWSATLDLIQAA